MESLPIKTKKSQELSVNNNKCNQLHDKHGVNEKFYELADQRKDLVELQKLVVLKELEIKEKELEYWNLKVEKERELH